MHGGHCLSCRVGLRPIPLLCQLVTESIPIHHFAGWATCRCLSCSLFIRAAHRSRRSCIVGPLHSTFAARSSAISGSAAMALHRKPAPGPSGRSLPALSVGAEVSGHGGQEDLVVTPDTDCLLRRCLCHPYAHEACACLYASDIRPRRLSSPRRYALRSDPRKLLSSLAVYVSLRLQACPLRTSPFLSDVLRVHPAKASTSPCPMARPSSHLPSRRQSPPRATARMCPYLCALRSALSTARLPHEVNKEQADTATQGGIGLHVGSNTARGQVCRVPSRNQNGASSRTQPHIPQNPRGAKQLAP